MPVDQNSIRATLRLHLAEGVGAIMFQRIIEAFGSAAAAARASEGQLRKVQGVGPKTAAAIRAVDDEQIDQELRLADKLGVRILTLADEAYPPALRNIPDPPRVLYVRGEIHPQDAVSVGVVGSRRCTHYGQEQAGRFGQLFGRAGLTVISGGARGIDTAAHRGALAAGGRTIAVMGCGLANTYPPENRRFFDEIVSAGAGALVSELPLRTAVMSGNFPTRNRIIAGMSLGTLVIEAARRSGSLITARVTAEQGRTVFALPGRVDSPLSQGTNELIRNGAILVQNLNDVLEHLGQVGEVLEAEERAARTQTMPTGLDETEQQLFRALEAGPMRLDELADKTHLETQTIASAMTMMVLKGAIVQKPGSVFARKSDA